MSTTESDLKKMTVKDLRVFAQENTSLTGVTGMKKEELLNALLAELGLEKKKQTSKVDIKDKQATKKEVLRLKEKQQKLMQSETKNQNQLKNIRRRISRLKKEMRKVS